MIDWAVGVNQTILRESDWEIPNGTITEKTRSGKNKTRPANQLAPDVYKVVMLFSQNEYLTFKAWYKNNLRNGVLSFKFPDIDTRLVEREYRIVSGLSLSNPSGKIIKVRMTWEEVK